MHLENVSDQATSFASKYICSPEKTRYTIALASSAREIAAVSFRILVLSFWSAAGLIWKI